MRIFSNKNMCITFDKFTPSLKYIALRWPLSKYIVKKYVMSNFAKPDLLKLCTCCLKDLNFRLKLPLVYSLKKLTTVANINPTYNFYHDCHHLKSVILVSSIFAKILNLKSHDKFFVVFIALIHDFNHKGRRTLRKPFYQEKQTINALNGKVFKHFLNFNKWNRVQRIILNTYFPKIPKTRDDLVEKIILDVDILVSIMFGIESGQILSKRLKHEQKSVESSNIILKNFLNLVEKRGLHLAISREACTK